MKKKYRNSQRKANGKIREISEGGVLLELPLPVADVIGSIPEVIRALSHEAGFLLMSAAMHSECEKIAGPKDSKDPLRRAKWWGSDVSPVFHSTMRKTQCEKDCAVHKLPTRNSTPLKPDIMVHSTQLIINKRGKEWQDCSCSEQSSCRMQFW